MIGTAASGVLSAGIPLPPGAVATPVLGQLDEAHPGAVGPLPGRVARAPERTGTSGEGSEVEHVQLLNINRADTTALRTLPGVGSALAERIVRHRETHGPFRIPEDLLEVPGIGAKRYARLHPLVRTTDAP